MKIVLSSNHPLTPLGDQWLQKCEDKINRLLAGVDFEDMEYMLMSVGATGVFIPNLPGDRMRPMSPREINEAIREFDNHEFQGCPT